MKSKTKKNSSQTQLLPEAEPIVEPTVEEIEPTKTTEETLTKKQKQKKVRKLKKAEKLLEDEEEEEGELSAEAEVDSIQIIEPIEKISKRTKKLRVPKLTKQELIDLKFYDDKQPRKYPSGKESSEGFLTKRRIMIAGFFTFLFFVRLFKVFF